MIAATQRLPRFLIKDFHLFAGGLTRHTTFSKKPRSMDRRTICVFRRPLPGQTQDPVSKGLMKRKLKMIRNKLTEDHGIFAAALPDMRAHFETAAKSPSDYAFLHRAIAEDLRAAEVHVELNGVEASARVIDNARLSIIAIAEQPEFYGVIAGDIDHAAKITKAYAQKQKLGM